MEYSIDKRSLEYSGRIAEKFNILLKKQKQRRITVISAVMFLFFLFIPVCEEAVNVHGSVFYDNVCVLSSVRKNSESYTIYKRSAEQNPAQFYEKNISEMFLHSECTCEASYCEPFLKRDKSDFIIPVGKQAPPVTVTENRL